MFCIVKEDILPARVNSPNPSFAIRLKKGLFWGGEPQFEPLFTGVDTPKRLVGQT